MRIRKDLFKIKWQETKKKKGCPYDRQVSVLFNNARTIILYQLIPREIGFHFIQSQFQTDFSISVDTGTYYTHIITTRKRGAIAQTSNYWYKKLSLLRNRIRLESYLFVAFALKRSCYIIFADSVFGFVTRIVNRARVANLGFF